MYLFCFGTRPEIIKQFPVMNEFKKRGLKFKTLFSGQHEDLIKDFIDLVGSPTYSITDDELLLLPSIYRKLISLNSMFRFEYFFKA